MASWIFEPAAPLADVQTRVARELAGMADTRAMATPEDYARFYQRGIKRLRQADMLPLEAAAAKMGITADTYVRKAEAGEVVLLCVEGVKAAPDWSIESDGTIDPLKLDVAREIGRAGEASQLFKFHEYLSFMTKQMVDVTASVAGDVDFKASFEKAAKTPFRHRMRVEATMLGLIEDRHKHPEFTAIVAERLAGKLTYGGWESAGSRISEDFMKKYGPLKFVRPPAPPLA